MTTPYNLRQSSLATLAIIHDLPTLPDRFLRIQDVLNNPESHIHELTRAIESDHATSATILKIANSSYYNPLGHPIASLPFAISRLGRKATGDVAMSMSLLYGFAMPASIFVIRKFWAHAFGVGEMSRYLSIHLPQTPKLNPDEMFTIGLLHDIGRVILGMRIDISYFEGELGHINGDTLVEAEREVYGIDHAEIGGIILQQWGIPECIANTVKHHHDASSNFPATMICKLADSMVHTHLQDISEMDQMQLKFQDPDFLNIINEQYINLPPAPTESET